MELVLHTPPRGSFTALAPLPRDTHPTLVGPGVTAVRVADLGTHNALYQITGYADSLAKMERFADGSCMSVVDVGESDAQPQMVVHPAVGDDPSELVPICYMDGDPVKPSRLALELDASVRKTWHLTYNRKEVDVHLWLSVATLSPVVEAEAVVQSRDAQPRSVWVDFEFGEPAVAVHKGGATQSVAESNRIGFVAKVDTAGISGPHIFRIACRSWFDDDADDFAQDYAAHPLRDLTADELSHAALGPWFGLPRGWAGEWFGGFTVSEAFRDVRDWESRSIQSRPRIPRNNPNAGGTDQAFGATFGAMFGGEIFGRPDPRTIRTYLWSAAAWGEHPIHYQEENGGPMRAGHPELTMHKLQPWQGKVGDRTLPIGKGALYGKSPFDGQHRAFMLPLAVYACTGSPALRYLIQSWLGAELYDRRKVVGWLGNGREEGRIRYNVEAAIALGFDEDNRLHDYLDARHQTAVRERVGAEYPGPVRPLFTSSRSLPWEGWTPWEEAQAAWGWWRTYQRTGSPSALQMAHERAQNVAHALAKDGNSWWIAFRVRDLGDGSPPDLTAPVGVDYLDPLYGPGGLFSWAVMGLRTFLLTSREQDVAWTQLHVNAAKAVKWCDEEQGDDMVTAHMSLRGSFSGLVEEVAAMTIDG